LQLPSAAGEITQSTAELIELPLFPKDPIAQEQFCLVLTAPFSLLMVLGQDSAGHPSFNYSFDPAVVRQGWQVLRSRLALTGHAQLPLLDGQAAAFAPSVPDYRWVMDFGRLLLQFLPTDLPMSDRKRVFLNPNGHSAIESPSDYTQERSPDIELLQALTHEIRTPLTTIRTMTRLLLRSKTLTPDMAKRLGLIDQECSDQIDRMELILRATELQNTPEKPIQLVPTSLEQVFAEGIPRWQRQAQRRNVDLDIKLPTKLPQVVSDPAMLDQVLTGLLEKFTRSLTVGGQIRVQVSTAGHQLKLRLQTQATPAENGFKALGQLLLFQPATGSLSLNLDTTKHLCHAMGGKLIVRQRSCQGEEITIFLPLGNTTKRHLDSPSA
jgi:signal transduction histidine kinase